MLAMRKTRGGCVVVWSCEAGVWAGGAAGGDTRDGQRPEGRWMTARAQHGQQRGRSLPSPSRSTGFPWPLPIVRGRRGTWDYAERTNGRIKEWPTIQRSCCDSFVVGKRRTGESKRGGKEECATQRHSSGAKWNECRLQFGIETVGSPGESVARSMGRLPLTRAKRPQKKRLNL